MVSYRHQAFLTHTGALAPLYLQLSLGCMLTETSKRFAEPEKVSRNPILLALPLPCDALPGMLSRPYTDRPRAYRKEEPRQTRTRRRQHKAITNNHHPSRRTIVLSRNPSTNSSSSRHHGARLNPSTAKTCGRCHPLCRRETPTMAAGLACRVGRGSAQAPPHRRDHRSPRGHPHSHRCPQSRCGHPWCHPPRALCFRETRSSPASRFGSFSRVST